MAKELKVLFVEDSEDDARLLAREFTRAGYEIHWERVQEAPAMRAALDGGDWDLVIADYVMPDFSAPAALRTLQEVGLDLPFIVVSGTVGEDVVVEVVKAGAHDYMLKTNLTRLLPAAEREIEQARLRQERRRAEERVRRVNRTVRLLGRCNEALVRIADEEELLQKICDLIVKEGGHSMAWVSYAEPDEAKGVRAVASAGLEIERIEKFCATRAGSEGGCDLAASATRRGQPRVVKDAACGPSFAQLRDGAALSRSGSCCSLPLRSAGRSLGALTIYALQPDAFDDEEVELLTELADDLAYGIVSIRTRASRDEAEKALKAAEERYRGIFEHSVTGIFQTTLDGRFVTANPALARIHGYDSAGELITSVTDLNTQFYVRPGRREEFIRQIEEHGSVREFESEVYRKDGSVIWISEEGRAILDAKGKLVGFDGTTVDITNRKLAEQERVRLVAILEATPDLVATVTPDGRFLYMNRAGRRLLGIGDQQDLSAFRVGFGRPEWAKEIVFTTALPTATRDGSWIGETAFLGPDGCEVPVSQIIIAHRAADGSVAYFSTIARDLTQQRKLEEQMRQAQKMESIGQLAGGVAHDFNNILTVILGNAGLLLTLDPPQGWKGPLQEVVNAADRAAALTRQLLLFSRRQVMQAEDLDLNKIVANVNKMLRRLLGEDIALHFEPRPALPLIHADPGMIEQVIMNLAVNARDAMPGGGRLAIGLSTVILDAGCIPRTSEAPPGQYVCLSVSDTGCGIAAEHLAHIFEPFFTTKEAGKGTGLGLATVYGIVQQHQGCVDVRSAVGQGTTFDVYLPVVAGPGVRRRETAIERDVVGGTETLLFVEDEESLRELARQILESHGYTVLKAESGAAALEVWRTNKERIRLLLTDLVMPGGMSGSELARTVREDKADLPVVYVSGYGADRGGQNLDLQEGVNFLRKPYRPEKLAAIVRRRLDETNKSPGGAKHQ